MHNAPNCSFWLNLIIDRALTTWVATSIYGLYRYVEIRKCVSRIGYHFRENWSIDWGLACEWGFGSEAAILSRATMRLMRADVTIPPATISKAKISIAVIWINALVMSVLPVSDVKQENFLLAYCYSHFLVPSFILTTAYLKIYKKIILQRNELQEVRASLTAINRKKQLERDNRMVIAFVLILGVFYCSFLPYFIFVHILYFCPCRTSHAFGLYRYVANEFLSVSSMVDPFMYAWRLPRFNRSFRSCFQRLRKRNAVAELNGTSSNINLAAVGRDKGKLTVAHSENSSKTNPCMDVGTKDSTLKTSWLTNISGL